MTTYGRASSLRVHRQGPIVRSMRRMHIGLQVDDLGESIEFYTRLFGCEPTLRRPDYAKWMLEDPRVNFSLDTHGAGQPGSAHYGIQVETHDELADLRSHIDSAELPRSDQNDLVCGYQLQHKSWVTDPTACGGRRSSPKAWWTRATAPPRCPIPPDRYRYTGCARRRLGLSGFGTNMGTAAWYRL